MEQQRVFLAIALSLGVLFAWQYLFTPPPEAPEKGVGAGATVPRAIRSRRSSVAPASAA